MMPLTGYRVLALGGMAERPLARFLESLGADVCGPDDGDFHNFAFVIDDLGLPLLDAGGWGHARLASENPGVVHASVTTFGSTGPRAGWRGSELVASAMGGTLRLTGNPDRKPVKEALDACTFHADMVAAAGMMAAHWAGTGQHIDVSIQEVAFNRNVNGVLGWQFDRRKLHRSGGALNYGRATVRCIWPLADGWCFHSLMTGRFGAPANRGLSDWMDEAGCDNPLRGVDWLSYNRSTLDPGTRATWEQAIAGFFATRTKEEIATEGRRRGINACVVAEPMDVLADPHLAARDFWRELDGLRYPGRFVRVVPGNRGEGAKRPAANGRGPLAGLRVLDFSWALVGSITTKTLGDLGADVIKVESRSRPCLSRLDVQVSASAADSLDDKPWFAHLNTSKRSLALDLKHPRADEVLAPLIEWADVIVENFSPGTMAKLGLDFASLSERRPGIVVISGSVYGQTGPLAHEWGVDGTGGALSGRTFLTGWPDRDPVVPGSVPYGDVILPFVMAAAGLAALQQRQTTGQGAHIDASMYEVCVQQMRQAVVDCQQGGRPARSGNADADVLAQDVYASDGEDRWIAMTLATQDDLDALHRLLDGQDVATWAGSRSDAEAASELQQAGIAAGAVQDIEDLVERDPGIAERHSLVTLDHPILGPFGHMRTPIDFSGCTPVPFRAPSIGEHSEQIARDTANLAPDQVADLAASGVFE